VDRGSPLTEHLAKASDDAVDVVGDEVDLAIAHPEVDPDLREAIEKVGEGGQQNSVGDRRTDVDPRVTSGRAFAAEKLASMSSSSFMTRAPFS
jgi:hypothetical protein